jgi:transcription termination factor NusB
MGRRAARELIFKYLFEADMNKNTEFKKELYNLGCQYDFDIVDRIFDDWEYIDEIITKYKKDIGDELNGK